jgi:hypothetical protein
VRPDTHRRRAPRQTRPTTRRLTTLADAGLRALLP